MSRNTVRNASRFGVLHQVMDAHGKLGKQEKGKNQGCSCEQLCIHNFMEHVRQPCIHTYIIQLTSLGAFQWPIT